MQRFIPNLLAAALAFSSVQAMAAADLVLFNGKVFTAEPGQGLVQAVAVQDGKILKVGRMPKSTPWPIPARNGSIWRARCSCRE